jgi:hypothetical protein
MVTQLPVPSPRSLPYPVRTERIVAASAVVGRRFAGTRVNSGFLMFFLALRGLCPYSARRARLVLFEAGRRACSLNSEEENETRWQNQ